MTVDTQLLWDMQLHVLGQPNLLITAGGLVQSDSSVPLNEEVRINHKLEPGFKSKYDTTLGDSDGKSIQTAEGTGSQGHPEDSSNGT